MLENAIFENYKIIAEHKKSRYSLLKEKKTGKLVIVDLVTLKIIYKISSNSCKHLYVKPKDFFINVPKICLLKSKDNEARVIFLREYSKSSLSGILVFENDTLCVFNSLENSMIRVKNINKAVVLAYYGFFQEENYVYSEYKLKIRYLNVKEELQELSIDVSNKFEVMNKGDGTVINELTYFETQSSWYCNIKTLQNIEEVFGRDIDVLQIPSISKNKLVDFRKVSGITKILLTLSYKFLS